MEGTNISKGPSGPSSTGQPRQGPPCGPQNPTLEVSTGASPHQEPFFGLHTARRGRCGMECGARRARARPVPVLGASPARSRVCTGSSSSRSCFPAAQRQCKKGGSFSPSLAWDFSGLLTFRVSEAPRPRAGDSRQPWGIEAPTPLSSLCTWFPRFPLAFVGAPA